MRSEPSHWFLAGIILLVCVGLLIGLGWPPRRLSGRWGSLAAWGVPLLGIAGSVLLFRQAWFLDGVNVRERQEGYEERHAEEVVSEDERTKAALRERARREQEEQRRLEDIQRNLRTGGLPPDRLKETFPPGWVP